MTRGGGTVVRLFPDVGKEIRATEIVTESPKIGQERERGQNLRIMAFLEGFSERYSVEQGVIPGMVIKIQANEAFSAYTDLEDNADLKEFEVKLLYSAFIVKDIMGNNQVSFGMGFDEVWVLLRSMEWSYGGHMALHMSLQEIWQMNVVRRYTITSYVQFLIWLICICMVVRLILRTQKSRTTGNWCRGWLWFDSCFDYKRYRDRSALDDTKDLSYTFNMGPAGREEEVDNTDESDSDSW